MASAAFHSLIKIDESREWQGQSTDNVQPADLPKSPPQAQPRAESAPILAGSQGREQTRSEAPNGIELDMMPLGAGACYTGPHVSMPHAIHKSQPTNESLASAEQGYDASELESVHSAGHESAEAVSALQTFSNPSMNKWRVICACLTCMGHGMIDSAPGALLPYIEEYYSIGYAVVSLMFVGVAVGFIVAAFFIHALDSKLGRARTLMLCDAVMISSYIAIVVTPPFPVVPIAFVVSGAAAATTLALHNVFCANLANATVILGLFHGGYGVGATFAPILATSMVTNGILFSRFYFIPMGVRIISLCFGGWAFWHFERDAAGHGGSDSDRHPSNREYARRQNVGQDVSKAQQLKQSLKSRTTLVGALYIFGYQASEVTISSWVISFLISYRGNDPSKVGYVTAGFWGGITVGRFILSYAAHRIGEKAIAYALVAGALAFQLVLWLVPDFIGDIIATALLGLLLGPLYPCASTVFTRLLPRGIQNTSLAFIASAGSSGGALIPFMTGIIAQGSGTWVMHPICIAMLLSMEATWFALPKTTKRRD